MGVVPPNPSKWPQHKYNVDSQKKEKEKSFSQACLPWEQPQEHCWFAMRWLKCQNALDLTCILKGRIYWQFGIYCVLVGVTDGHGLVFFPPEGAFSNNERDSSPKWSSLLCGVPSCLDLTRWSPFDVTSVGGNVPLLLLVNGEATFSLSSFKRWMMRCGKMKTSKKTWKSVFNAEPDTKLAHVNAHCSVFIHHCQSVEVEWDSYRFPKGVFIC